MALWLLDVNVLVALAWEEHMHHTATLNRMDRLGMDQWATCAITQLGFLRLSSTPGILSPAPRIAGARAVLEGLLDHPAHRFLSDPPISPVQLRAALDHLQGYRQITDAWLIALAAHHGARVLTFDRAMCKLGDQVVEVIAA